MRSDYTFESCGIQCASWLYRPSVDGTTPCIVMAHGLSGVREQRLDAYAERFMQAGMTVLVFDYRYFGESGGESRQLLSIDRQLQDWEAAVATARSLPGVDADRIALFGTSFSGGHVQVIAARDAGIAAVVSQVPFCDGLQKVASLGIGPVARLTFAGLRDIVRAVLGQPPYYVPVVGTPGETAFITEAEAGSGFAKITPPDSHWRNEICARLSLSVGTYRPGLKAAQIRCPILFCIAQQDMVTPAHLIHQAAKRAALSEVKSYPCGHFDVYLEPFWEKAIADQVEFLSRHLQPH